VQRFRPNIVVGGLEAYAEDDIISIQDEAFTFTHISACERCVIINMDHETGEINSKAPLKMLNQYRRIKEGYDSGVLFGSYYSVNGAGTLNVGDSFEVNV
ncbi:MAG: MOSC domain-containing protein, partial [Gammaproteobacteria bacterium]|nr:MOSC domain-containing protein [Gammaproteobacteria bacterium]